MSVQQPGSAVSPPCIVCDGEMAVKEVRHHTDPTLDVWFFKCAHCGLERPTLVGRDAVKP